MKTLAQPRDKAELLQRLRSVRPEHTPRWGRMSAHQMVCHLADTFRMATGDLPVRPDTSLFKRTLLKALVLYVPMRWPAGITTSPEVDQEGGGTKPLDFAADVARVEALMDAVTATARKLDRRPHPFFGEMSDGAWLRWGYLHTDHHLRQFGA